MPEKECIERHDPEICPDCGQVLDGSLYCDHCRNQYKLCDDKNCRNVISITETCPD